MVSITRLCRLFSASKSSPVRRIRLLNDFEGQDPWDGYRAGFVGTTELNLPEFGITFNLGPAAETVYMDLVIEGVRQ